MAGNEGTDNDGTQDTTDADNALGNAANGQQDNQNDQSAGSDKDGDKDWKAEADKWKALARKHETRVKELGPLADKAKKMEDQNKTQAEKLTDELAAAQVELAGFRVSEIRRAAATEAKLDPEMAQFITATTPEAALEQAQLLAQRLAPQKPPAGDFKQGARQQSGREQNKNDLLRSIAGYQS